MTLEEAPAEMATGASRCALSPVSSPAVGSTPGGCPGGSTRLVSSRAGRSDWALDELRAVGVRAAMVSAGGDLATFGGPEQASPWRIGVRDPWAIGKIACVLESPGAVATSGCYERGSHVIDPKTGRAETRCESATVTGPDLWLADALATGLLVAGEAGLALIEAVEGYEACVISGDGSIAMTGALPLDPLAPRAGVAKARRPRRARRP